MNTQTYEELVNNALNTIGPNSVPENAGMVYALIAIAQELKRGNDLKALEVESPLPPPFPVSPDLGW